MKDDKPLFPPISVPGLVEHDYRAGDKFPWLADYPYEENDTQRDWQYDVDSPSPALLWLAGAICFGAGLATGLGLAWVFG